MKKLLLVSVLAAALGGIIGLSGPYSSQSFINGTSVLIPCPASASTTVFTSTNTATVYTNDLGQVVTAGTNAAGITYGPWGRAVRISSDALGQAAPYSISITTPASHATNTITVLVQRSPNGTDFDNLNQSWSFVVPADTGAIGQTMVTNVPTVFTTGASHLRIFTLTYATNSTGFTNAIGPIRFNGFAP